MRTAVRLRPTSPGPKKPNSGSFDFSVANSPKPHKAEVVFRDRVPKMYFAVNFAPLAKGRPGTRTECACVGWGEGQAAIRGARKAFRELSHNWVIGQMSNFNKLSSGELPGYVYIPHENTVLIPKRGVDNRYQELMLYYWGSLTKEFKAKLIPFDRWWKLRLSWNLLDLRYVKCCQVNADGTSL